MSAEPLHSGTRRSNGRTDNEPLTDLDWPARAGAVDDVLFGLAQRRRLRRRRRMAFAAGLAVVLGVAALWRTSLPKPMGEVELAAPRVAVLQPARQVLPDGSVVELRPDAEIAVEFGPASRRVVLLRGEAHFSVQKDAARPFVVAAAGVEVRAVGTEFSVDLAPSAVAVVVNEGHVAVEQASQPDASLEAKKLLATLTAGDRTVVEREQPASSPVSGLSADELEAHLAWRVPRLEFSGVPLGELVVLFNRHNHEQLVLRDPQLAHVRLSGVLRADRVEALLAMLAAEFGVRAERRDGAIELHAQR